MGASVRHCRTATLRAFPDECNVAGAPSWRTAAGPGAVGTSAASETELVQVLAGAAVAAGLAAQQALAVGAPAHAVLVRGKSLVAVGHCKRHGLEDVTSFLR